MAGLHVDDINLIKQVIEIASTRGAFQAGELKAVGEVYDKVTAFLAEIEDNQKRLMKLNKEHQTHLQKNNPQPNQLRL